MWGGGGKGVGRSIDQSCRRSRSESGGSSSRARRLYGAARALDPHSTRTAAHAAVESRAVPGRVAAAGGANCLLWCRGGTGGRKRGQAGRSRERRAAVQEMSSSKHTPSLQLPGFALVQTRGATGLAQPCGGRREAGDRVGRRGPGADSRGKGAKTPAGQGPYHAGFALAAAACPSILLSTRPRPPRPTAVIAGRAARRGKIYGNLRPSSHRSRGRQGQLASVDRDPTAAPGVFEMEGVDFDRLGKVWVGVGVGQ